MTRTPLAAIGLLAASALGLAACSSEGDADPAAPESSAESAPTNRIELSADAMANLGVTFATARRGRLREVLSIPGQLVAPPGRRFEVRAPAEGVVRDVHPPYTEVRKGDVVAQLVTEELGRLQGRLLEARERITEAGLAVRAARADVDHLGALAEAKAAAAESAERRVAEAARIRDQASTLADSARRRLDSLARLAEETIVPAAERISAERDVLDAAGARLDAERQLTDSEVAHRERRLDAARAAVAADGADELVAAREHARAAAQARFDRDLDVLGALSGLSRDALLASSAESGAPAFASLAALPLAAPGDGVVTAVHASDGGWLDANETILAIVDGSELLFEGEVPEGDLAAVFGATDISVIPAGGAFPASPGTLVGPPPLADEVTRMVTVRARVPNREPRLPPGISATAELVVSTAEFEEVLIPAACLVQDGLEFVVFRRDPADPSVVIRTPVAKGRASGGWVEVFSGVGEADELVLDGVRQLKQLRLGPAGGATGHFHADGTWHEGDE